MRQGRGGGCTGRQWEESRATGHRGESEVRAISAPTSDFLLHFSSRRNNRHDGPVFLIFLFLFE